MNRRQFLKGTAGFVIACGVGFGFGVRLFRPASRDAVGPMLINGLETRRTSDGAKVYADGSLAFTVNNQGAALLSLANGNMALNDIIERCGLRGCASDASRFFITLGSAGYLQNRVEVTLFENYA